MDNKVKNYADALYEQAMTESAQITGRDRVNFLRQQVRHGSAQVPLGGNERQALTRFEVEHIERCIAAKLDSYRKAFDEIGMIPSDEDLNGIWQEIEAVQQGLINQTAGGLKHSFKTRGVDADPTGSLIEGSARGHDRVLQKWKMWRAQVQLKRSPEAMKADLSEKEKRVWVVHGRDMRLRDAMFTFLHSIGLKPLEFSQARDLTRKASPYVGEILEAAFQHAQAVLVLLTPDDEARLRPDLLTPDDEGHERELTGQARPNVLFEAGMALVSHPNQTVLIQIGKLRPFSDVAGRHLVHMDGSTERRQDIANRLRTAGCPADLSGTHWHTAGDFTAPPRIAQSSDKTKSTTEQKKPEPNLHLGDIGLRQVHLNILDTWETGSDDKRQSCDSVLIQVRNDPDQVDVPDAYIKGQLIFKGPYGAEYRANPCAWIGEEDHTVRIKSGTSKNMVAAIYSPTKSSTITNLRDTYYPKNRTAMEFIELPPVSDFYPVEIVLIDEKSGRRLKTFQYEWRWGFENPTLFIRPSRTLSN